MTTNYVDTVIVSTGSSTNAFGIGGNDNIVVSNQGALLQTGANGSGLDMFGSAQEATIWGEVYGTNDGILTTDTASAIINVNSQVSGENDGIQLQQAAGAAAIVTIGSGALVQGFSDGIETDYGISDVTINGQVSGVGDSGDLGSGFFAEPYAQNTTVFVAAGGSVTGTEEGIALDNFENTAAEDADQVTVNGTVAATLYDGIWSDTNGLAEITVNGQVSGAGYGIHIQPNSGTAEIVVGTNGAVTGGEAGIVFSNTLSDVLTVNGDVTTNDGDGIDVSAAGSYVTVNGRVDGATNGIWTDASTLHLAVNGDVQSEASGVQFAGGTGDLVSIGGSGALDGEVGLYLNATPDADIKNDGHIEGSGDGLFSSGGGSESIINGGTISSSSVAIFLSDETGDYVQNTGLLEGAYVFEMSDGAQATLHNTGTMDGDLSVTGTSSLDFDNAGTFDGAELNLTSSSGNGLTNAGTIDAPIQFGTGSDLLANSGVITGSITFDGSADGFANSGTITGALSFGTTDSVTNNGTIHGSLTFGTSDTIANDGTVYGTLTLGDNDKFVNTGTIHGNIDANTFDQITVNPGTLLGDVVAEAHDSFHFAGGYGAIDISGFVATGTGHDTLYFSTNDFANYTALEAHMTQASGDVLITLDPADVVTLVGTTLSSLSSTDFAFS